MKAKNLWTTVILGAAALLVAAPLTMAGTAPGTGIEDTAHDFSGRNAGGVTTGKCTFCHTPHRAIQTRLLWNHTLSANTFSWSDAAETQGGTPLPTIDPSWTGPTKFCLSCHDGSVAIGDIAWFNKQTWVGNPVDNTTHGAGDPVNIGLGGDMAGNHPVAHPFPFQGSASTYNGTTTGAPALLSGWQPDPQANGIRLFHEDALGTVAAGAVVGNTGIECSSCHDPHNGAGVQDVFFLRGEIGDGPDYICTKCHNK